MSNASNTAPSTPETPRRMGVNRSFTVPSKLAASRPANPAAAIGEADGIETLYAHPNASIIKFSSGTGSRPTSSIGPGSPRSPNAQNTGTLPWASLTERTLAAGPLEIYRVPGSVSFLHSGALLHAILPRSQCWCVDGVSKFALRVLPDTYYRIELPGETPEDLEQVEALKLTLQKVLYYERTPCPFARGFTIDLPEEPETRRSKRKNHGPAKRWTMDRAYSWKPEGEEEWPRRRASGASSGASSDVASEDEETSEDASKGETGSTIASELTDEIHALKVNTPSRPKALAAARSITAPPQLTVRSTPPSRIRTAFAGDGTMESPNAVAARPSHASTEAEKPPTRLREFHAIPTDMPPSPPDSSAGAETTATPSRLALNESSTGDADDLTEDGERASKQELPRMELGRTVNVAAPFTSAEASSGSEHISDVQGQNAEASPTLESRDFNDDTAPGLAREISGERESSPDHSPSLGREKSTEDPYAAIQARILARRSIGGTTSFHPKSASSTSSTSSTATIGSTLSRRSDTTTQHKQAFATALVRKACAVFLGPPAQLVAIMLKIAARFANEAFGYGSSFIIESPAGSKHVPGSFNLESIDAEDLLDDPEWEEDDFGVPLRSPVRLAALGDSASGAKERRGWEMER